jgi:hypothetical protein
MVRDIGSIGVGGVSMDDRLQSGGLRIATPLVKSLFVG